MTGNPPFHLCWKYSDFAEFIDFIFCTDASAAKYSNRLFSSQDMVTCQYSWFSPTSLSTWSIRFSCPSSLRLLSASKTASVKERGTA